MRIDSELQSDLYIDIIVYTRSLKRWEPPYDSEPVSLEDRLRIQQNISLALRRMKVRWE